MHEGCFLPCTLVTYNSDFTWNALVESAAQHGLAGSDAFHGPDQHSRQKVRLRVYDDGDGNDAPPPYAQETV